MEYPRHMVYETYDEMDLILAKLHTPTFESDETLSLGPFGVFEGIKQIKETRSQKSKSSNKRRKAEKGKSEETVVLAKEQGFSWNAANNLNNDINVQFQEIMATLSTPIPGAFTSSEPMFEEILSTMFSDVTNPLSEEVDYQSIQDNLSALLATDGINFNFGESPSPLPAFNLTFNLAFDLALKFNHHHRLHLLLLLLLLHHLFLLLVLLMTNLGRELFQKEPEAPPSKTKFTYETLQLVISILLKRLPILALIGKVLKSFLRPNIHIHHC